jgi:asparagine synthase (glutamine-hydrolysing)
MSGIAGIIHFDGAPIEPGQIERMTSAMAHRGPDGIHHWIRGPFALGQCMLRTTPESLKETQPLTNEDESLVLVMDGRVDNWEELRRELLGRGAVLRTRADAELVLRAYEIWGEACPDRIIGEYAFFIWDARQRRLFAARDAAGTRHFYYYAGRDWFAFASEIKGLLALDRIEPRLNESRVLDYLVPEFDRDDVVGTFYQDISRMPAGHAMSVTEHGPRIWRYWNPGELPEYRFSSLDECAEAFLEQLRIAVKCRLRSIGPVGAMLSGGLDSSSIVGLIRKEFRDELTQPLNTFSLIREDRENCKDWEHIQHMLKDGWIEPTVITSARAGEICKPHLDSIRDTDEPFAFSHGLTYGITYEAAREKGCNVVLDGMAGDLLFYGPEASLNAIFRTRSYAQIPAVLAAWRQHDLDGGFKWLARAVLSTATPERVKAVYRALRAKRALPSDELKLLYPEIARRLVSDKRTLRDQTNMGLKQNNIQAVHARHFTTGLLSFAHEVYGQIAFSKGVEPRSPLSDRRMIEFAIQMPIEAKISAQWYKNIMRKSMVGHLPPEVCWRRDLGNHPGWTYFERLILRMSQGASGIWDKKLLIESVNKWIDDPSLVRVWNEYEQSKNYSIGIRIYNCAVLAEWIRVRHTITN